MTDRTPDDRRTLVDLRVDRAWREASREEPPATLDAALLAAAHRAVGAGPQPAGAREAIAVRRQWWPLAAAATVAAIAVGVLQLATPEHVGAPAADQAVVSDMPVAQKAGSTALPAPGDTRTPIPAAPPPPVAETKPDGKAEARARGDGAEGARADAPARASPSAIASAVRPQAPAATQGLPPAPEPFPAAPKSSANTVAPPAAQAAAPFAAPPVTPSAAPSATQPHAAALSAMPSAESAMRKEMPPSPATAGHVVAERTSAAPAPMAKMAASRVADAGAADGRAKNRAPLPIPEWIALIRRLRDESKSAEAAKELAAFRAAHADHEKLLPPDLRDWHPQEK